MRLEFLVKIIYTFLICAIIKETILKTILRGNIFKNSLNNKNQSFGDGLNWFSF